MSKKLHDLIASAGFDPSSPIHKKLYDEITADLRPLAYVPDAVLGNYITHAEARLQEWTRNQERSAHAYEVAVRQEDHWKQELQLYLAEKMLRSMRKVNVPEAPVQRVGEYLLADFTDVSLTVVGERAHWEEKSEGTTAETPDLSAVSGPQHPEEEN